MEKSEIIRRLLDPGVIAIIRADSSEQLIDATRALLDGGIQAIEVTMTTPNALQVIRDATKTFGDKLLMGVGTVLDDVTARLAIEARGEVDLAVEGLRDSLLSRLVRLVSGSGRLS